MIQLKLIPFLFLLIFGTSQCSSQQTQEAAKETIAIASPVVPAKLQVGAAQLNKYLPLIKGKRIALVVNQTSTIGNIHLVDSLRSLGIDIVSIFAPEHGFRGKVDAGEQVADGKDLKTGIPLLSLYGKNKKPSAKQLAGIDWVLFDIQDVGARFYTYISTMHYVMDACAEYQVPFMVLDRPNPNGHYVDGPILEKKFKSFVGMHPIPIVHGMTVGEYAKMVNGQGWLTGGQQCVLTVIPCENYTHDTTYDLPIKPSPNLPNSRSIYLYPSLCLFEGTQVSVGRGTNTQFQVYGHPDFKNASYEFTPVSMEGAKYPKHENQRCKGYNLQTIPLTDLQQRDRLNLSYLLESYRDFDSKPSFFLKNLFFDKLAGTDKLRLQIIAGKTESEIRDSWQADLKAFNVTRSKYLLYE